MLTYANLSGKKYRFKAGPLRPSACYYLLWFDGLNANKC